jgi:hypothetical protein
MNHRVEFTMTLDLGILGEHDVKFLVNYLPATRDVMYMPNGDPGYPGDPAEVEILSAWIGDHTSISALIPEDDELYAKFITAADESIKDEADAQDEQSLDYFNRHIAGDR